MESLNPVEPSKVVIEIVRTETIKPLTPTPDHLKKFGMTVLDRFAPDYYMPLVFFYPAGGEMSVADRNRRLKESLSGTLARFYPVAGRVDRAGAYVDCDDSGADFIETKVNGCSLADILGCPDIEVLRRLIPRDGNTSGPARLVRVQSNLFECGGMVVGACFSHSIMDGCSRNAFLKEWAAAARGETVPLPDLEAVASRFPAIDNALFSNYKKSSTTAHNTGSVDFNHSGVMRRFVFDSIKINSLRDKATSASGVRPTRVEAVTALIYKCLVNALTMQLGHARPLLACQSVNLRSKFDPPLSETPPCNMVSMVHVKSGDLGELVNDLPSIIAQFKEKVMDLTHECATKLTDSMTILKAVEKWTKFWRPDIDMYFFSSLCGFRIYELDFGWGTPVWISIATTRVNNSVAMIDAREGGGIEAWITLREDHMAFFETNTELLEFASLNPTISLS